MNDLIRDVNKYGEEQVKIHRKVRICAEERYHDAVDKAGQFTYFITLSYTEVIQCA